MIVVTCCDCGKEYETDHAEECTYGQDILCRTCIKEKQLRAERDSFQRVGIHTLNEFTEFLEEVSDLWDVHEIHYRAAAMLNKYNKTSELKMVRFDCVLKMNVSDPRADRITK